MSKKIWFGLGLIGLGLTVSTLAWSLTRSKISPYNPVPTPLPLPAPQRLIFMGDTGSGSSAQSAVAQAITTHCAQVGNCTAVIIPGDVIYENGVKSVNDPQFKTKFEQPYAQVLLPFYVLYGNHDYLGCQECYLQYASHSAKWRMPARYYTQQFGSVVTVVGLDTEQLDQTQQDWLNQQLTQAATSSTPWVVVTGHRPVLTYETTKLTENWHGKAELQAQLCHQADLYLSGHSHVLEDVGQLPDCRVHQIVSGTGGSYPRTVQQPYPGSFAWEGNGFVSIEFSHNKMLIEFFDQVGQLLHTTQQEKL